MNKNDSLKDYLIRELTKYLNNYIKKDLRMKMIFIQIKKNLKESLSYGKEEHSRKRDDISKRIIELFTLYSELKKMLLIYRQLEVEDEEDNKSNFYITKKPQTIRLNLMIE